MRIKRKVAETVDRSIALTPISSAQAGQPFYQPAETKNLPGGRSRETLATIIISALADDIADTTRFPLRAIQLGTDKELENDPIVHAFNVSPRHGMSAGDLRKHIVYQLELTGEAYLVEKNGTITPLLAATVDVLAARAGQTNRDGSPALIAGYIIRDQAGQELGRYDGQGLPISGQAEGQLFRILHPYPGDPYRADAPVSRAKVSIQTLAYARQAAAFALQNAGVPSGLITVEDPNVTQQSVMEFDRRINSRLTDIAQRGRVLVAGSGIKYESLQAPDPADGIRSISEAATKELLAVWSMPSSRLGDTAGRTFENQRVETRGYILNAIGPRLNLIASALNQISRQRGTTYSFEMNAPELSETDDETAARATALYMSGLITKDEARELVGFAASTPEDYDHGGQSEQLPLPLDEDPDPKEPRP